MKILGITAEYNPFHNGHAYHIREAKARTGCDSVIALMSGDFVQRGTPAIVSKYVRAEAALRLGADIVIELPVYSATASAEGFAEGAIRAFSDLGVDAVSYGIECDGENGLTTIADQIRNAAGFFTSEPEPYREQLKKGLSEGLSYPAARAAAYEAVTGESAAFLSGPNTILAIEYEKAIIRRGVKLESVPVERKGSGYHDTEADEYASATAIRKMVEKRQPAGKSQCSETGVDGPDSLAVTYPAALSDLYGEAFRYPVFPDDLSSALFSALHGRTWEELALYSDISEDTAKRLAEVAKHPFTWTSLTEALHERSHTQSHVNRALCHILLGITKEAENRYRLPAHTPFLHVLGIRKGSEALLGSLASASPAPLLVRLTKDMRALPDEARGLFETELNATALHSHILYGKGAATAEERLRKFLVV
jgi:predicted nucleotidyltransferase